MESKYLLTDIGNNVICTNEKDTTKERKIDDSGEARIAGTKHIFIGKKSKIHVKGSDFGFRQNKQFINGITERMLHHRFMLFLDIVGILF